MSRGKWDGLLCSSLVIQAKWCCQESQVIQAEKGEAEPSSSRLA